MNSDEAALFARIDDKYSDEFVWLTRVDEMLEKEIKLRFPRCVPKTQTVEYGTHYPDCVWKT